MTMIIQGTDSPLCRAHILRCWKGEWLKPRLCGLPSDRDGFCREHHPEAPDPEDRQRALWETRRMEAREESFARALAPMCGNVAFLNDVRFLAACLAEP